jgi:hypothetical protein
MSTIDVTAAGDQRYQVDIRDDEQVTDHDVGVPDELVARLDTDGLAMRDIVAAAVEFLIGREGRDGLDHEIDLGEVARRHPDLLQVVPQRARELAAQPDAPPRDETRDSDERLIAEVEREQEAGEASEPTRRL